MKNIHLIICLFIFPLAAAAQNQSIDSLKKHLKTTTQDTIRVNLLNNISTEFIEFGHFDSANRYIKPSIDLLEKLHYKDGEVTAYHNLALYNFHIKEYKTGKFFLLKSLNAALLTHDKINIAANYKELADLYQLQSNFKLAKESNNKYVLYKDSLANEESVKHDNKALTAIDSVGKEKVEITDIDIDTNAVTVGYTQKQKIVYLSIGILLILLILTVWLMIGRLKRKNILLEEDAVPEQNNVPEKPIQLKKPEIEKANFLQKITELEELITNNSTEKKQPLIESIVPIKTVDEIDTKNVTETKIEEKLALGESEKVAQKPANEEIVNTNIVTAANEIETKPEQVLNEPNIDLVENSANNTGDENKNNTLATVNRRFSNLIFTHQLPHFTAKFLGDSVKLFWKTDDEKNINQFNLEKSVDGFQYVNTETIVAKGFGSNNYDIIDFKPLPGINYYRLELIDTEGDFIYSQIVQVEVLPVSTLTLICYPTHVKDVIMVTAAGGKMPILVNIFNKSGKKEFSIETPPITTPVYLTNLTAGTYTLQIKCEGKTILQQLIKA